MSQNDDNTPFSPCFSRVSETAFLLEYVSADQDNCSEEIQSQVWNTVQWLEPQRHILGIVEIVPGMGNLLLQFDRQTLSKDSVLMLKREMLNLFAAQQSQPNPQDTDAQHKEIPIIYGGEFGPDLKAVADACCLSIEQVIDLHSEGLYRVFCLGFQPGFAYLGGLNNALHCPRKQTPAMQIPAGSVAIGGAQTGIYPFASPGGWQIIGRTDCQLFDPLRDPPSFVQPGDRVRFRIVSAL